MDGNDITSTYRAPRLDSALAGLITPGVKWSTGLFMASHRTLIPNWEASVGMMDCWWPEQSWPQRRHALVREACERRRRSCHRSPQRGSIAARPSMPTIRVLADERCDRLVASRSIPQRVLGCVLTAPPAGPPMVAAVTGSPAQSRRRPHCSPAASRRYERRRPEKTPLHKIISENLESWLEWRDAERPVPGADDAERAAPPAFLLARPINQADLAALTERVRRRVIRRKRHWPGYASRS